MKLLPIFDLTFIILFVIHGCYECQTQVKKLPPLLPRTDTLPFDTLGGDSGIKETLYNKTITAKHFLISSKCFNDVELEEDTGVLIITPTNRLDMDCKTVITAMGQNTILNMDVQSNDLRFGCPLESLNITMDLTSVLMCRGGGHLELKGKNLTVIYKRKMTERFGSFVIIVVSVTNLLENIVSVVNPHIDPETCGLTVRKDNLRKSNLKMPYIQPRIVGGVDATENEFPWMAHLLIRTQGGSYFCGGTLISDQHVLTAAHCVGSDTIEVTVTLGRYNILDDNVGKTVLSTVFKTHELFNQYTLKDDISLIKLPTKVDFSNSITPICLPSDGIEDISGEMAAIIGFGDLEYGGESPTKLQVAQVKIWEQNTCSETWTDKFSGIEIFSSNICALGINTEDTCLGDSGGPLIHENIERNTIVGITSFGDRCAIPGVPGVYTRVSEYSSWLNKWMVDL